MPSNRVSTIATYALLASCAALTFVMPRTLTVPDLKAAAGDEIILNGVIRDFSSTHPDFDASPTNGYGHYAGIVNNWLPGTRRPLFVGGAMRVASQWENLDGKPIAPNMSGVRGGLARTTLGFRVADMIELKKDAIIDGFNSTYGPYGVMGNYGMDAIISTNATADDSVVIERYGYIRGDVFVGPGGVPADVIDNEGIIAGSQEAMAAIFEMPEITYPDDPLDLEPYDTALTLSGNVTLTGDTDPDDGVDDPAMHLGDFTIQPNSIVTIEGDLRIRVDRSLEIEKSQIILNPEANLAIWVSDVGGGTGDIVIRDNTLINVTTADTSSVSINAIGTGKLEIDKKTHVYATIVAPQRKLFVKDQSHFYGGLVADSIKVENKGSGVHVDLGNASTPPGNFALSVREKIELDNAVIDAFDSNDGPYGGANIDSNAWVTTNAIDKDEKVHLKNGAVLNGDVMIGPYGDPSKVYKIEGGSIITGSRGQLAAPYPIPIVTPPAMGMARVDEVEYNNGTINDLATNLYCKKLKINSGTTVRIQGDVTIRCDDKLEMKDASEIILDAGATLTLYLMKELKVENLSKINANTGNPQLVSIRMMSLGKKGKIELRGGSEVVAWSQGAKSELDVENATYYGSFTGQKVKLKGGAKMHVDMAYLTNCVTVLDTPGSFGVLENGGITDATTFDQWYRTLVGVNQTIGHPITLTEDGFGVWTYLNDEFYPIDDRLMGNESDAHNNHFTYTIGATFEYSECGGQFIEFYGGDSTWLFIDGRLVLDLGGVRPLFEQYVELDRLGLEDGETYDFRLFTAQRKAGRSFFRLKTNVELDSNKAIPAITAMFD